MKIKSQNIKSGQDVKKKKNLTVLLIVLIGMIALTGVIFYTLSSIYKTKDYYVIKSDIASNQIITTNDIELRTMTAKNAPENLIEKGDIQQGSIYTRYALSKGDMILTTNTSSSNSKNLTIPEGWATTSISIPSDLALNGTIAPGEYFDILGVNENEGNGGSLYTSQYIAVNVLALEVTSASNTQAVDEGKSGQYVGSNLLYTVALPVEYAGKLHADIDKYKQINFLRSPANGIIPFDEDGRENEDLTKEPRDLTEIKEALELKPTEDLVDLNTSRNEALHKDGANQRKQEKKNKKESEKGSKKESDSKSKEKESSK